MSRKAGFTRTETVVVLGGATILGAALWPIAVRAQNAAATPQAMSQSCQSNLKQVGLGLSQYQHDNDGKLPMATYENGRTSWRFAIVPYIRSVQIMRCPSNPNRLRKVSTDSQTIDGTSRELRPDAQGAEVPAGPMTLPDGTTVQAPAHIRYDDDQYIEVPNFIPISYAANANAMWRGGSSTVKETPSPAEFIVVGESTRGDATMPFTRSPNDFGRGRALFSGHIGFANAALANEEEAPEEPVPFAMTNCLFADGHVKAYRPMETLELWFNAAPDNRAVTNYERRLSAADEFFTNWLSTGEMPESDDAADAEETEATNTPSEE